MWTCREPTQHCLPRASCGGILICGRNAQPLSGHSPPPATTPPRHDPSAPLTHPAGHRDQQRGDLKREYTALYSFSLYAHIRRRRCWGKHRKDNNVFISSWRVGCDGGGGGSGITPAPNTCGWQMANVHPCGFAFPAHRRTSLLPALLQDEPSAGFIDSRVLPPYPTSRDLHVAPVPVPGSTYVCTRSHLLPSSH